MPEPPSSWPEWLNPARWIAFVQRVLRAEKELHQIREENAQFASRLRELERAVDRQAGYLAQLDRYIEARIALEVQKALEAQRQSRRQ